MADKKDTLVELHSRLATPEKVHQQGDKILVSKKEADSMVKRRTATIIEGPKAAAPETATKTGGEKADKKAEK